MHHLLSRLLPVVTALALLAVARAAEPVWCPTAPEGLPPVTVRWEDPNQSDVFVVEGEHYQCRVGTLPARILSYRVDGQDLLGAQGLAIGVADAQGTVYEPCPAEVTPVWEVWRSQQWRPATSPRARMNVWSASPYYWDAHVLDIPLLSAADLTQMRSRSAEPPLVTWDFSTGDAGWKALNQCTFERGERALRIGLTGEDPYCESPVVDVPGPVAVTFRLRTTNGGGGVCYWLDEGAGGYAPERHTLFAVAADGEWHDYTVVLNNVQRLRRLRFDPPGTAGTVDLESIQVHRAPSASDAPRPHRGELILHAHPDRLHLEVRVDPAAGRPAPTQVVLRWDGAPAASADAAGEPLRGLAAKGVRAAILPPQGAAMDQATWRCPASGTRPGTWLVFRPQRLGDDSAAFDDLLHPLPDGAVTVRDGHWLGYDPAAGLYRMELAGERGSLSFEEAWRNAGARLAMGIRLANDARARRLVVKSMTGVGNLEAAVLADRWGFPLPVPAFVAKNFGGEREEPDDSGFGDVYFPLHLAPGEERDFQVLNLVQNWGDHPLKQVSSIRFFHIYWHLSTGASETTCFTHNWMPSRGAIFHIPDFRPMSGPLWSGQPQHDCQQWPGWLQYHGARGKLVYDRTVFESVSPNLARFTMHFHTADDTARAQVQVLEAPQRDELRTFVRLRYDWIRPCVIEGDARREFRWFNMLEKQVPELLVWTGPDGQTVTRPVAEGQPLLGQPLAPDAPVVGAHGSGDRYHSLVLVRRFAARLGGQEVTQPALSAAFDQVDRSYWLTTAAERLSLQPGDWLEADLVLMPHGEPVPPTVKPERERRRYGTAPAQVTAQIGEKLSDWPPRVRAADEVAAFRVAGGHGELPLVVEGFRGAKLPLLWRGGVWQNQQVHGGDGYQVEPDGQGGYRFSFVSPHRDDQQHDFLVTRAECTGDIARVWSRNGRPRLEAAQPGTFRLRAPGLFAPGRNVVAPDRPVAFEGEGPAVEMIALRVEGARAPVTITVTTWTAGERRIATSGPVTLVLGDLRRDGRYQVTVAGQSTTQVASGGSLKVAVPQAGEVRVATQ